MKVSVSHVLMLQIALMLGIAVSAGGASVDELGTVISKDGHLRWSKTGSPARFFGTALFLADVPKDDKLNDRAAHIFSKYGMNLIRFHYHGMFYSREGQATDLTFNPVWMEDIDRVIAATRKYGVYFGMSGLFMAPKPASVEHFRQSFYPGDDPDKWREAREKGEVFVQADPRSQAIYLKVVENFLNHVNPFTKMAYKDDPAFLYWEVWNEWTIGYALTVNGGTEGKYTKPYLNMRWRQFLKDKYRSTNAALVAWGLPKSSTVTVGFKSWRNEAEMRDVILFGEMLDMELYGKIKSLIDKMCGRDIPVMLSQVMTYPRTLYTQTKTSLGGCHAYYSFAYALDRTEGVPLIVDEVLAFAHQWEGNDRTYAGRVDNRVVSIQTTAAAAALQDLDGIAYFNSHWFNFVDLAKDANPVQKTPWGLWYEVVMLDPILRSMLYSASKIYVRQDLDVLKDKLVIHQTPERLLNLTNVALMGTSAYPPDWVYFSLKNPEQKMFEYLISNEFISGDQAPGLQEIKSDKEPSRKQFWVSMHTTGQMPGGTPKGWQFRIDTPRTQGFWGWKRQDGPKKVTTEDFDFVLNDEVCAIIATSESMEPLSKCKTIILTTAGRAQSGMERRDGEWKQLPPEYQWPNIELITKRPFSQWTLQSLDDAFEPYGEPKQGKTNSIKLDSKVHFYRLTMEH